MGHKEIQCRSSMCAACWNNACRVCMQILTWMRRLLVFVTLVKLCRLGHLFFKVSTNSGSATYVNKLCQRILRQQIMCQQIQCQQIMCQQILCEPTLSTNYVNKCCPQNMSTHYVSTNYVNKLCQQIMSTNSASTNYVSTN